MKNVSWTIPVGITHSFCTEWKDGFLKKNHCRYYFSAIFDHFINRTSEREYHHISWYSYTLNMSPDSM